MALQLPAALLVAALLWAGGAAAFAGTPQLAAGLVLLLLLFAAAALPWGYCISLRCATPAAAQVRAAGREPAGWLWLWARAGAGQCRVPARECEQRESTA